MKHVALLIALVACGATSRTFDPAVTRELTIVDDLVVRGEADGFVSVMARVSLDDTTTFGVVLLPASSSIGAERSPHVVVARARAWHALARMLERSGDSRAGEAATRGARLLPACDGEPAAAAPSTVLPVRLRCYTRRHALPKSTEELVLDGDTVVREDATGASVITTVAFDGAVAAGHARVVRVAFADVAKSRFATLARGRAWQLVARMLDRDIDRSYEAAKRGLASMDCKDPHWRNRMMRAHHLEQTQGARAARDFLRGVLDETLVKCVGEYARKAKRPRSSGARAF